MSESFAKDVRDKLSGSTGEREQAIAQAIVQDNGEFEKRSGNGDSVYKFERARYHDGPDTVEFIRVIEDDEKEYEMKVVGDNGSTEADFIETPDEGFYAEAIEQSEDSMGAFYDMFDAIRGETSEHLVKQELEAGYVAGGDL